MAQGLLIKAVSCRYEPGTCQDGGPAEVLVVLPQTDLPGELPCRGPGSTHDPVGDLHDWPGAAI